MPKYNVRAMNAPDSLRALLRNVDFRRSFGNVRDPRAANIKRLVKEWGEEMNLSAPTVQNVEKKLNIKTHKEFTAGIKKIVQYLRAKIGAKKYALLVEGSAEREIKSEHWILGPVLDGLRRQGMHPPTALVPSGSRQGETILQRALASGVEVFVRADDAAYSGMQLGDEMMWLVGEIDESSKTNPVPQSIEILFACVFATQNAGVSLTNRYRNYCIYFRNKYFRNRPTHRYQLSFYKAFTIGSIENLFSNDTLDALYSAERNNLAHGYLGGTILSHMVPNTQSFFSRSLAQILSNVVKSPYKNKRYVAAKRKPQNTITNRRKHKKVKA